MMTHQAFRILMIMVVIPMSPAWSQQNVLNVPNAEIPEKGEIWLQHQSDFRPWQPDRRYTTHNAGAVGLGANTELDVTLFNVQAPRTEKLALAVGFRSVIPLLKAKHPEREFRWTVGDMVPVSLDGGGVGNWGYSHLSGKLPKLNTRLIAGISAGTEELFGRDTVHFIGAAEQPLTRDEKLKLLVDWFSGTHDFATLSAGLGYAINERWAVQASYQIPNNRNSGRSSFSIQVETRF